MATKRKAATRREEPYRGVYIPSWTQRGFPMKPNERRVFVDPITGKESTPSSGESRFMIVERRDDGFEYVTMNNVIVKGLWGYEIIVRPHGKGWEKYDTSSDKWWVWRRKAVPLPKPKKIRMF